MSALYKVSFRAEPITTTTDQVFEALYDAIVALQLPPGSKVSEADIASQMNVSRQPVRDAFFRLSELGFLSIRPQRATLVTKISIEKVQQATFIRAALELACLEEAISKVTDEALGELDDIIRLQAQAVKAKDGSLFHELDDKFHSKLCQIGGRAHVWTLIREQKAHMDRVRFLSLPFSSNIAYNEHQLVMSAIRERSQKTAKELMRAHLERILTILHQLRDENAEYFEDTDS